MKQSTFDKLNLRPQERRLIVITGLAIFVVLNIWFVWPYFSEWGEVRRQMDRNRLTLHRYQQEIARRPQYEERLNELKESGSRMLTSEIEMQTIVQSQAAAAGLQMLNYDSRFRPTLTKTNQFFEEQTASLRFSSGGEELVDFLVGIAAQDAMIRVREMDLRPDPSQTRLVGNIILVGNYQKKATNAQNVARSPRRRG